MNERNITLNGVPEPRLRISAGAALRVRVARGDHEVLGALNAAGELLDRTGAPFVSRPAWLSTWYSRAKGEALAVRVEQGERTVALGCLAIRRTGPLRTVLLGGDGPSDYGRLPAWDEPAAVALARGIVEVLLATARPWRLRLAQLPVDDPTARELLYALPGARLVPGQGCPAMTFGADRSVQQHLPAKGRRAARRCRARLAEAGVAVGVQRVHGTEAVRALLGEVVAVCRARDHALGRRSDLDRASRRTFYATVVLALAESGQLDVWTLRCDDDLAAYVIGVRDGATYRAFDARIAPAWQQASPGQILRTDMITELLTDTSLAELDWMRGEVRHKMQDATHVVPAQHLLAESSPGLTTALRQWQRLNREARNRFPDQARRWGFDLARTVAPAWSWKERRERSDQSGRKGHA